MASMNVSARAPFTNWSTATSRGQNIPRGEGICAGQKFDAVRLPADQRPDDVAFWVGDRVPCWHAETPSPVRPLPLCGYASPT